MNRLIVSGLLVVALLGGYTYWQHRTEQRGVQAERARQADLAEQQRMQNRSRSRDVELAYADRTIYRDRFITQTITEIRHAAADLAVCPVPAGAVRLLNAAAECAREDRPAACAVGEPVR